MRYSTCHADDFEGLEIEIEIDISNPVDDDSPEVPADAWVARWREIIAGLREKDGVE